MTPAQKLKVKTRQVREQTVRLMSWIDRSGAALEAAEAGLRDYMEAAAARCDAIDAVIDDRPAVGVISVSGRAQPWLVGAMLDEAPDRTRDPLDWHAAPGTWRVFLDDCLTGCTATLRFRGDAAAGGPKGFPYRLGLLGLADIAAILLRVHHASSRGTAARPLSPERLREIYATAKRNLGSRMEPGLTHHDVHTLRDFVVARYPDKPALRALAASGYWETLADLSDHLSIADRDAMLSLLWQGDETLTVLFVHLREALASLAFSKEVFCPLDAVLEHSSATGWLAPHPWSVLAPRTLLELAGGRGERLRVVTRYGLEAHVYRSALAALVSEMTIRATPAPPLSADDVDIVSFPMPVAPVDLMLPAIGRGADDHPAGTDSVLQSFASAKPVYLFERSVRCHDLACLVVAIDPTAEVNEALHLGIAEWIAQHQGTEPHARERVRTGLLVAATKADAVEQRSIDAAERSARHWAERLQRTFAEGLFETFPWPSVWAPSHPYDQIFPFQHHLGAVAESRDQHALIVPAGRRAAGACMLEALAERTPLCQGGSDDTTLIERALAAPDGGASLLLRHLAAAAVPANKLHQLSRLVSATSQGLQARILRFGGGAVADAVDGADIEIGLLLEQRVDRIIRQGNLGQLLSCLMVSEFELDALPIWLGADRIEGHATTLSTAYSDAGAALTIAPARFVASALAGVDPRAAMASATIAHWLVVMRRVARSTGLRLQLGLSQGVLDHVVDELALTILRRRLDLAMAREMPVEAAGAEGAFDRRPLVSIAARVINDFVETLAIGDGDDGSAAVRPIGFDGGRRRELQAQRTWTGAAGRPIELAWPEALAALIEGNRPASHNRSGS